MLCSDCGKEVLVRVTLEVEEKTDVGMICLSCLKRRIEKET